MVLYNLLPLLREEMIHAICLPQTVRLQAHPPPVPAALLFLVREPSIASLLTPWI